MSLTRARTASKDCVLLVSVAWFPPIAEVVDEWSCGGEGLILEFEGLTARDGGWTGGILINEAVDGPAPGVDNGKVARRGSEVIACRLGGFSSALSRADAERFKLEGVDELEDVVVFEVAGLVWDWAC